MSNIYIQEPPTYGKVLLKTSVGDIDIELWAKETPKACRNFVQLCLEGYYNGTLFHRIVKGFIAQGGDPTGTGTGGESIYGKPFKDEIHSRLRFVRRGLVAMANAGKDDNGSQFFFTFAATPELQNKHTIFGKVTGETVYNMIKLEDALVDHDDRPQYPQKILSAQVLMNPFPDIVPRVLPKNEEEVKEKKKKDKTSGVKNFKLLSFGEEAEEDEEEVSTVTEKLSGRAKSSHDVLNDPKLSSVPAVEVPNRGDIHGDPSDDSEGAEEKRGGDSDSGRMQRIKNKLKKVESKDEGKSQDDSESEDEDKHNSLAEERKRKVENIRKEINELKRSYQESNKKKKSDDNPSAAKKSKENTDNAMLKALQEEESKYKTKYECPKKGASREQYTLNLLNRFREKIQAAKERAEEEDVVPQEGVDKKEENVAEEEDDDDDNWMAHKLQFESNSPTLAKDASTKDDDWYEIHDPRSKISQRRREISKELMKNKERR